MRRALPVLTLVVLAPLCAEITIGDLPFTPTGLAGAVFTLPIYGAGTVLIRELLRRSGRGWPSLLLLGVAYGIVEEQLGLGSFTSASIYDGIGPAMGGRLLGINGGYTELQLVNHAVWSVTVPVLLTELIFRDRRDRPFLGRVGLAVSGLVYLLGVGLLVLSTHTQLDPGYAAPRLATIGAVVIVVVLGVVALRVLPPTTNTPRGELTGPGTQTPAPSPWTAFWLGLAAALVFLALLVLPGEARLAWVRTPLGALPMLAAAAVVVVAWLLVARWSRLSGWDDRHLAGLGAGALIGHTLIWGLTQPATWTDRVIVAALFAASVILLALLARRVARRPHHPRGPGTAARASEAGTNR